MLDANLVQASFRARNDDGSETTATWKATANTNWSQAVDAVFRVRFLIQETAGGTLNNTSHALEYSLNGGAFAAVTGSTPVQFTSSAFVADGTVTTQQLGTGTYATDPSEFDSDGIITNAPSWAGNDEVEYEACLTIDSAQVADSDTIQLRQAGLNSYTNTPTIAVSETTPPVEGAATLGVSTGLTGLAQLIAQVAASLGIVADLQLDLRAVLYGTSTTGPWTPHPWDSWSATSVAITPDLTPGTYYWRIRIRDGSESATAGPNTVSTAAEQGQATLGISASLAAQAQGVLQGAAELVAAAEHTGSAIAAVQAMATLASQATSGGSGAALALAEASLSLSAIAAGQADQAILAAATLGALASVAGDAMAQAVAAATLAVIGELAASAREDSLAAGDLAVAAAFQATTDAAQDAAAALGITAATHGDALAQAQAAAELAASGALTVAARHDGQVTASLATEAGLIGVEGSATLATAVLAAFAGLAASSTATLIAQGAVIAALGLQGAGTGTVEASATLPAGPGLAGAATGIAQVSALVAVAMQLASTALGGEADVTLPSGQVIRVAKTGNTVTVSTRDTTITVQSDGRTITVRR